MLLQDMVLCLGYPSRALQFFALRLWPCLHLPNHQKDRYQLQPGQTPQDKLKRSKAHGPLCGTARGQVCCARIEAKSCKLRAACATPRSLLGPLPKLTLLALSAQQPSQLDASTMYYVRNDNTHETLNSQWLAGLENITYDMPDINPGPSCHSLASLPAAAIPANESSKTMASSSSHAPDN